VKLIKYIPKFSLKLFQTLIISMNKYEVVFKIKNYITHISGNFLLDISSNTFFEI
jgi:hypothetical protein